MPDVRAAIVIYVAKVRAHGGERSAVSAVGYARLHAYLFESLASDIVEQKVPRGIVGHKNIYEAIAVVVRERDAHTFAKVPRDPHGLRNVSEGSVSVIPIQR